MMNRLFLSAAVLLACGGQVKDDMPAGSETHFLTKCTHECGGGLQCIEGVCTASCSDVTDCDGLRADASCLPGAEGRSCQVECSEPADCGSAKNWSCSEQRCAVKAMATNNEPEPICPDITGGVVEPQEISASAQVLPESQGSSRVTSDGDSVYWVNTDREVMEYSKESQQTQELAAAPEDLSVAPQVSVIMSLIAADDMLYWSEATDVRDGLPSADPPSAPSRVWAVPKAGGEAELVVDTDAVALTLLGVVGDRLVAQGYERLHFIDLKASSPAPVLIEQIPSSYSNYQLVDDKAYFLGTDSTGAYGAVFSAALFEGEPVELFRSTEDSPIGSEFLVNQNVLLVTLEILETDPLNLNQHFQMNSLDGECETKLPSLGTSIGSQVMDETHVYWKSFNGLGSVSEDDDANEAVPYVRAELKTGLIEQLVSDSFHVSLITDVMAQDADAVYIKRSNDGALVMLEKP